jgi:HSP20 family protein
MMNDLAPLMRMGEEMFEDFFQEMPPDRGYAAGYPAVNFWEDGDTARIEAELPGMSIGDIEVLVSGNEVTIKGQRDIAAPEKASYHRRERASGTFVRTLTLPFEIDQKHVDARMQDGVLTLRLPKAESAKPRKIKVRSA